MKNRTRKKAASTPDAASILFVSDTPFERRCIADNGVATFDYNLMFQGSLFPVRWLVDSNSRMGHDPKSRFQDNDSICASLVADEAGHYYGIERLTRGECVSRLVRQFTDGKAAMRWFIKTAILGEHFTEEFLRAIDSRHFKFKPLVLAPLEAAK